MATVSAKSQVYTWQGTDRQGRPTQGETVGTSQAVVKAQLRKQGIAAKTVKRKTKPLFSSKKAIKPADIAIFARQDRKSTRLNSSHVKISYAVFCLKNKID